MNKYIFIRHGQTDMNINKMLQGRSETKLNEVGLNQAKLAKEYLDENNIKADYVFSSPLGRARKTAKILTPYLSDENFFVADKMIEMCFGAYELRKREELEKEDPEFIKTFFYTPDKFVEHDGIESFEALIKRCGSFVNELKEFDIKHKDEELTVFVTSHGAAIRGVSSFVNKTPIKDFWKLPVHNLAMFNLDLYGDTGFKPIFDGYTDGIDFNSEW